ncbi:hypothetical protein GCM10022205_38910 [Spinactinospora alkalitolerans]
MVHQELRHRVHDAGPVGAVEGEDVVASPDRFGGSAGHGRLLAVGRSQRRPGETSALHQGCVMGNVFFYQRQCVGHPGFVKTRDSPDPDSPDPLDRCAHATDAVA